MRMNEESHVGAMRHHGARARQGPRPFTFVMTLERKLRVCPSLRSIYLDIFFRPYLLGKSFTDTGTCYVLHVSSYMYREVIVPAI